MLNITPLMWFFIREDHYTIIDFLIWKNDKTIVAYFVEYTVEKFEKFLII
jgi:hypothetical protein